MAAKISIECPACAAKLNLADSSKLGKKIKCPKCSEVFVAEADVMDDDDDLDEEPEPSSSRKRGGASGIGKDSARGSKKGGAKGKTSSDGSNLPLIIGGVVALLALAGGGLYFSGVFNGTPVAQAPPAMPLAAAPMTTPIAPPTPPQQPVPVQQSAPSQITAGEKVLGLRWMPTDTDVLVHLKVAAISQAPLLANLLGGPMAGAAPLDFEKQFKIAPADIESVSVGVVDICGTLLKVKMQNDRQPGGVPQLVPSSPFQTPPVPKAVLDQLHFVVVLKTKKPLDIKNEAATIPNSKLMEKNGKTYVEVSPDASSPAIYGGWLPDPNTFIYATLNELFASMERGETIVPRKEFSSVDHNPHLVVALASPQNIDSIKKTADDNQLELPGLVVALIQAHENYRFQIGSVGLTIKSGFDVQYSAVCGTDEGASKLKAETEQQVGQLKMMYTTMKGTLPPVVGELGDLLLTSLKVEETNKTIKVSAGIPDSAKEKLEQLPIILAGLAMMPGLAGGPAGPKGGNPFGVSAGALPGAPGESPFGSSAPYVKQAGETEGVEAASVEGLPEGLTLTARTAWSIPPASNAAGTATTSGGPATIDVLVDVTGDSLDSIYGTTGVTSKTAKLDGGSSLKRTKLTLPGGIDAQKTFIPFDVDNMLPTEQPAETLRLRLTLDLPSNAGDKIAVLEGSFKFLTAETSEDLTVENVPQTAKQPLKGPEFKAGGVKLIRGPKDASPETLKLECAKDHFLGRVRGTPGDIVSQTEVEKGSTIQRIYAKQPDGKFPEDFQIEFKLYGKIKEQTVTFRFENIPLPATESKPAEQSTPAQ